MADVIVGYDGSDGARAALDTALETSSAFGDRVVIAFGYHVQKLGGEVQDYAKALKERAEEVVSHGLHQAQAKGGSEVESVVVERPPAEALAELAKERGARMIVVGTHGEAPLKGAIVGSTSHKLLHLSEVPVLVVPAR
jgi:nucleotide-binding universal stress UspA family protein